MALKIAPTVGATTRQSMDSAEVHFPSVTYWTSGALALVAAIAAALTFFADGVLRGTAVMNGSARGTALILLIAALPLLVVSMIFAKRGKSRAIIAWLGSLAYILYNAVLFVFITPFNRLFLLYVAMLTLSIWTVVMVLYHVDVQALRSRFSPRMPTRWLAGFLFLIMLLNGAAWLMQVIPALIKGGSPQFLEGTGLTTNPIYVQDLGFWIPLMAIAGIWLWQHRAWGYVLVGALLTFGIIETIGVGVDQWFGANADPTSPVASAAFLPIAAVLSVVEMIPLIVYYRSLKEPAPSSTPNHIGPKA